MAFLEGEGNRTLEYYKKAHIDYFKSIEPNFNDNTKTITNSVYEIISKIKGKTLYYYWYKMTFVYYLDLITMN